MNKTYNWLIEDVQDIHRKSYLKIAIKQTMKQILKDKYTTEAINNFVDNKFEKYKGL